MLLGGLIALYVTIRQGRKALKRARKSPDCERATEAAANLVPDT